MWRLFMVACLTCKLSILRRISLPTLSGSSQVMPWSSFAANLMDRERSCETLPSNGSCERNQSLHLFMSRRSCRRLASPNSTWWWLAMWCFPASDIMPRMIMNCNASVHAVHPLLSHTFSHACIPCKTTTAFQRPHHDVFDHYVCPQSRP